MFSGKITQNACGLTQLRSYWHKSMFSGKITQKACKLPQIGFKLAQIVMFSGF
jgi:hypothetical protein